MNIVIPMAGRGSRFAEAGYATPKPLLKAHGKTLLEWSVDSLPLQLCERLIFVGLEEQAVALEPMILNRYGKYTPRFVWLKKPTRGQAETVLQAAQHWQETNPLLIYNIDTAFHSFTLKDSLNNAESDGVLGAFRSREPRFSFAAVGADGFVSRVAEKEPISDFALTGLYHFRSTVNFVKVAEQALATSETVKGEYYVAPLYDKLIRDGKSFTIDLSDRVEILGTPEEYERFLSAPESARFLNQ